MTDYLAAFVTLMGLVSLIMKHILSDEAQRTVRKREIEAQEKKDLEAIQKDLNESSALTSGADTAWEAADRESENYQRR